jgi:malonate transporter MadL subunit
MTIYGVALLAICTLLGALLGDVLGVGLGVKTNVGGVGISMMMLMAARVWLMRRGALTHGLKLGIEFWAALYIPIVVAMAATQNVVAAVSGGPVVLIAGAGGVAICLAATALLIRFSQPRHTRHNRAQEAHAARVISGAAE